MNRVEVGNGMARQNKKGGGKNGEQAAEGRQFVIKKECSRCSGHRQQAGQHRRAHSFDKRKVRWLMGMTPLCAALKWGLIPTDILSTAPSYWLKTFLCPS